jgi:hypothetical protein
MVGRASRCLVLALLAVGWGLYLVSFPAVYLAAADARLEVARYFYKRLLEPRCMPLELGAEADLVPVNSLHFEPCEAGALHTRSLFSST